MDYTKVTASQYVSQIKKLLEEGKDIPDEFHTPLETLLKDKHKIIEKGTKLYRGRYYDEDDVYAKYRGEIISDGPFQGYDEKGSFVNFKGLNNHGRANREGEVCLYVSKDIDTCCLEIGAKRDIPVSIGLIEVNKDLKIIDLSEGVNVTSSKGNGGFPMGWVTEFKSCVDHEMCRPVWNQEHYKFTQYICNYIKNRGYDGVKYDSSIHFIDSPNSSGNKENSYNYAIFNYEKCRAISSSLYLVRNVSVTVEPFQSTLK